MKKWFREVKLQVNKAAKYGFDPVLSYSARAEICAGNVIGDLKLLVYNLHINTEEWHDN